MIPLEPDRVTNCLTGMIRAEVEKTKEKYKETTNAHKK